MSKRMAFWILMVWVSAAASQAPPVPGGWTERAAGTRPDERLPEVDAYGFVGLDRWRYGDARGGEATLERFTMRDAGAACGLFSYWAGTDPVELEGLRVVWSPSSAVAGSVGAPGMRPPQEWAGGVGQLLSGRNCWRSTGLDRVTFMLWARALAAAGAAPAQEPPEGAELLAGSRARFVRVLPTPAHLARFRPELAALPSLAAGARRFLLVETAAPGLAGWTLVAESTGAGFDRAALAADLEKAGFSEIRRLGSRLTARVGNGLCEFMFTGTRLTVRPIVPDRGEER